MAEGGRREEKGRVRMGEREERDLAAREAVKEHLLLDRLTHCC